MFDLTIADNIAYGMNNVSIEDIIGAAMNANIHHFIQQLPEVSALVIHALFVRIHKCS